MKKIVLLVLLVCCNLANADDGLALHSLADGASPPPASIEDLAWLTGRWQGEAMGGLVEEVIAPALGGQMMGMFRHAENSGKVIFYEFYLFAEVGNSLVLKIKHFTPQLHGWEEKTDYKEFKLVSMGKQAVHFDGVSYAIKDGQLRAAVRVDENEIIQFRFSKAALD